MVMTDVRSHDQPVRTEVSAPAGRPAKVTAPDVPRTAARDRRKSPRAVLFPPLVTFGACLGIWYLFAEVLMPPDRRFLVPPPQQVWQAVVTNGANRSELLHGLWITTEVSMTGLAIAAAIGIFTAVLMSLAPWIEATIYPYAVLVQVMPILAIVPLLGLLFGFGFASRVIVCVIIALFPIITNTLFGLKSADQGMHDLFSLMRVSRTKRLLKLQLPAAMPAFFAGLRIAGGAAVVGAVVGDFFFQRGEPGLGVLIQTYSVQLLTPQLYGVIICSALLGIAVFWVFTALSKMVTGKWYPGRT